MTKEISIGDRSTVPMPGEMSRWSSKDFGEISVGAIIPGFSSELGEIVKEEIMGDGTSIALRMQHDHPARKAINEWFSDHDEFTLTRLDVEPNEPFSGSEQFSTKSADRHTVVTFEGMEGKSLEQRTMRLDEVEHFVGTVLREHGILNG